MKKMRNVSIGPVLFAFLGIGERKGKENETVDQDFSFFFLLLLLNDGWMDHKGAQTHKIYLLQRRKCGQQGHPLWSWFLLRVTIPEDDDDGEDEEEDDEDSSGPSITLSSINLFKAGVKIG